MGHTPGPGPNMSTVILYWPSFFFFFLSKTASFKFFFLLNEFHFSCSIFYFFCIWHICIIYVYVYLFFIASHLTIKIKIIIGQVKFVSSHLFNPNFKYKIIHVCFSSFTKSFILFIFLVLAKI